MILDTGSITFKNRLSNEEQEFCITSMLIPPVYIFVTSSNP